MIITDANGNTIKTGKPARNWCAERVSKIIAHEVDSAGRVTLSFEGGDMAKFFPAEEPPKLIWAIGHAIHP